MSQVPPANPPLTATTDVTLRDYFASQVVTGLLGNKYIIHTGMPETLGVPVAQVVDVAYQLADCLLERRLR